VVTTILTEPTERGRLLTFYRLIRPAGPGWEPIRQEAEVGPAEDSLPLQLLGWMLGIAFVYSALFGTGSFLYGRGALGTFWLVVFVASGLGLLRLVPRLWGSRGN
jgi:hypothetical protein